MTTKDINSDYILTSEQWMEHRKAKTGRVIGHKIDDDGQLWTVVTIWQDETYNEIIYFVRDEDNA